MRLARRLISEIFFRVQDLFARRGRTLEQLINRALVAFAPDSFDEAHAVAVAEDERFSQQWREECADLCAIFVEARVFHAGHIVERAARPLLTQLKTALHVHRIAFDDGEERLFAVEVVRARE